ncbi:MAG: hypothetical protein ACT4PO_00420 [Actinomycetota bacterium]
MSRPPLLRIVTGLAALGLAASACTASDAGPALDGGPSTPALIAVEVASADLYAGAPQRFLAGLLAPEGRLVSFGTIEMRFAYTGTVEEPTEPQPGPEATAAFIPTPGTPDGGAAGPSLTLPSEGRGVYQAEGVTFDRAGIWQVTVSADLATGDGGPQTATASFFVAGEPALPAPGQPALRTENLTVDSKDAPEGAIDSRALASGRIPDSELHRWTIADAIAEGRPALVVFATPTFCISRFCGPVTDAVAGLAARFGDRAVFIHIEIWRDHDNFVINRAAADWLLRDGDLVEPWLFLIGADGNVADRWGVLFDPDEVAKELRQLPVMS